MICKQDIKSSEGIIIYYTLDLRLSVMKPIGAQWMVKLYQYFKSKPEIITNGFKAAGIISILES